MANAFHDALVPFAERRIIKMMKPFTCSFYGLGLIGGSIARALREARPDARILACDIQESALLQAKEEGIADEIFLQLDASSAPSFWAGDYIFLWRYAANPGR